MQTMQAFQMPDEDTVKSNISGDDGSSDDEESVEDVEAETNIGVMNPRLRLAVTVKNWTMNPDNHAKILEEGAVHALIALAGVEDAVIRLNCITALYNLTSKGNIREELLMIGVTNGITIVCMNLRTW